MSIIDDNVNLMLGRIDVDYGEDLRKEALVPNYDSLDIYDIKRLIEKLAKELENKVLQSEDIAKDQLLFRKLYLAYLLLCNATL